jgi:hypothetical protein
MSKSSLKIANFKVEDETCGRKIIKKWFVGNPTTLFNPLGQKAQLAKLPHSYQLLSIVTFGYLFYYIKKR